MMYAEAIVEFLSALHLDIPTSTGVEVLNPYKDKVIFKYCKQFYKKYYSDTCPRTLLIGINPGRFGGGLTGIPFTDPIKLQKECGIKNDLHKRAEMSGDFIYKIIHAYGGEKSFYKRFYFSSISPLGFTCKGKNLNYYDMKWLQDRVYAFVIETMRRQLLFGLNRRVVFCLGMGKNYKFLLALNQRYHFFEKVIPLPHPRFVMQYRRKRLDEYVKLYIQELSTFY